MFYKTKWYAYLYNQVINIFSTIATTSMIPFYLRFPGILLIMLIYHLPNKLLIWKIITNLCVAYRVIKVICLMRLTITRHHNKYTIQIQ